MSFPRLGLSSWRSPSYLSHDIHESSQEQESSPKDVHNDSAALASYLLSAKSVPEPQPYEGPSMLTEMIKRSPPPSQPPSPPEPCDGPADAMPSPTEESPLLSSSETGYGTEDNFDAEGQKVEPPKGRWGAALMQSLVSKKKQAVNVITTVANPKRWDRKAVWKRCCVDPVACLPAVIVGLLLNILDALSYGMILFPLGDPLFAHLGAAGISIFYVSTILSQLTFSTGSIFKGAIGSELIEVVPFFHSMAKTITTIVGRDNPDAVIATTITSYALSSMLTGLVFYSMGKFKLGSLVGFIPRHILIGCIGGVGWFLIVTGFEVTAKLGSFHYDLETAKKLIEVDTLPLWLIPLGAATALFYALMRIHSKYFLPLFILSVPLIFYLSVFASGNFDPPYLREHGWIFEGPPSGEPWWYFYTLYKFNLVHWDAIGRCVPAMLALTFFGILHVPINVPALAQQTGEDHANLDHELKLHGFSNLISGLAGSIQNYLVYANTAMFVKSGGNTRLAGYELAVLTFLVMTVGPSTIGFIPVMMVGVLIYELGFELLSEAVWAPKKKLEPMEYMTVIAIVLVMGIYDFVYGILVGVILALASLVFQTSRISAVRNTFSGDVVGSTVRRNPTQHHYLKNTGRQVKILKLSGFLFFGTIVGVEKQIRDLISAEAYERRPIKFLILDLWHVSGLDYSAGEGFNTIARLLKRKGIVLTISGVQPDSGVGRTLRTMGVAGEQDEVLMLPTLNSALESCENELLKTFYASQEQARPANEPTSSLDVPRGTPRLDTFSMPDNSPRTMERTVAAKTVIEEHDTVHRAAKWRHFTAPLRLILQIFDDLSDKNEDFWFGASKYFVRRHYAEGFVLFRPGGPADGFWLLEKGMLRAEYNLPQGFLCESIVAGTTCGELPFFSNSRRTATVIAERECDTWLLTRENWDLMREKDPDIASEFLNVGFKLSSERMESITGHTLAMA
ncbi:uncharacterized protein MKZ38_008567 [Zalerion maritima]|uniref:Sulfate transporter n=1 Tax=Zalerion maritima TaxID=339359 RepID=A0AAD5RYS3_9PEZI|nr:uncharacterized protein MKZ38_008567 [Zalerion maritima]